MRVDLADRPEPLILPEIAEFQTFRGYWLALTPEQAMGLAVVSLGESMDPEEFIRTFCAPGSGGVTLYPQDVAGDESHPDGSHLMQ